MAAIFLSNGREFIAEPGIALLDAATSAHIPIPYSCRTGRCNTCKARVVKGQTRTLASETGLSTAELEAGWILTCVRAAETDVTLEVEDLQGITLPQPQTLPCRISELLRLAPDVLQVKLRLPPASNFSFIPGQYIDVIGPNQIRRSYSLAQADYSEKILELHIRAVEGGTMSEYWFNQAKPNDLLRLYGPLGTFFLREYANVDIFFLATGTGIAPIKAMLESIAKVPKEQQPKSVTVLWGGREPQDFYFDVMRIHANQRFVPVLSRSTEGWRGARGYVQDVLLSSTADLSRAFVYACGSDRMIQSAKQSLCNAGLPVARFYSDAFVRSGSQ
ncbi:2Fe-2S iron-sulfur cluster-binding protein [Herbaspirillum seropedicae]|uniref:2Fe-2S iron-sulfur cluster-binding protein n=1 Tax=Herbaspirillum seropedicae TaxID=964 RepID=UPI003D992C0D